MTNLFSLTKAIKNGYKLSNNNLNIVLEKEGKKIIFDPFLNGNPMATVKPEDIECNYIIITHGHGDHIGKDTQKDLRDQAGRQLLTVAKKI